MRVSEEPACIYLFEQNPVFSPCIRDLPFISYRLRNLVFNLVCNYWHWNYIVSEWISSWSAGSSVEASLVESRALSKDLQQGRGRAHQPPPPPPQQLISPLNLSLNLNLILNLNLNLNLMLLYWKHLHIYLAAMYSCSLFFENIGKLSSVNVNSVFFSRHAVSTTLVICNWITGTCSIQ